MNRVNTKFAFVSAVIAWIVVFLVFPVPDFVTQGFYAIFAALAVFVSLLFLLHTRLAADWTRRKRRFAAAIVVLVVSGISCLVPYLLG
jgi:predicted ABC-type exoprotein transport system permease subunit